MDHIAEILSAMMALAEPGYSEYSRVELAEHAPCAAEWCYGAVEELSGKRVRADFEYKAMRAEWRGYSRAETPAEGRARFATIAVATDYVERNPPESWRSGRGAAYPFGDLSDGLVTIMRHESAYWRSVHEGRIRGAAGEWCLVQIHPSVLDSLGVTGEELVGIDLDSTIRCLMAGAELLGRARRLCPPGEKGWFGPTIAAYGSGQGCLVTDEWVSDRVDTFHRVQRPRRTASGALLAIYFATESGRESRDAQRLPHSTPARRGHGETNSDVDATASSLDERDFMNSTSSSTAHVETAEGPSQAQLDGSEPSATPVSPTASSTERSRDQSGHLGDASSTDRVGTTANTWHQPARRSRDKN